MNTPCPKIGAAWWMGWSLLVVAPLAAQVALVQHAPEIAGTVEGSIQQMAAESVSLEGAATITGDWFVPGSPSVKVSNRARLGSTLAGNGAAAPSRYTLTLNPGTSVGRLRPRTDPVALPAVAAPPRPAGRREVTLTRSRRDPGDFATLRDLELKEGAGPVAVPPGNYGEFKVHERSILRLGVAGATAPVAYGFQKLELKSGAELQLAGPVVVTLGDDLNLENAVVGNAQHPEWLVLRLASGDLKLQDGSQVFAQVAVPKGEVTLGERTGLTGGLVAGGLSVHRRGVLTLRAAPVSNPPVEAAVLPYAANFETAQGYAAGPLHRQQGWETVRGTASIGSTGPAADGALAVELGAGAEVQRQLRMPAPPPSVVFADVFLQPSAGPTAEAGSILTVAGARLGFLPQGTTAALMAAGQESVPPGWQAVGPTLPVDASGRVARWVRLTVRLDFSRVRWDLWLDGNLVGADLALINAAGKPPALEALVVSGPAANPSRLDSVYVGGENPLYADADHDGMDDAWELANGLSPDIDDRDGDRDGDGLSNWREYRLGLRADRRDSDGDGMADDWEIAHGLDPKVANSLVADADADGVTDLEEFLLGTDPRKADSDGDGLPDFWEAVHQLDPASPAGADADPDGDGLTNRQEFAAGTDPRDFFNGVEPVTEALGGSGPAAGAVLEMKVTKPDGSPWPNAPVTFQVTDGARRISATAGGPAYDFTAEVRADANGVARAYLEPLEP